MEDKSVGPVLMGPVVIVPVLSQDFGGHYMTEER
jgi:hypothetical protein